MTDTYFDTFPIETVETVPLNGKKEKAEFILNDAKNLICKDFVTEPFGDIVEEPFRAKKEANDFAKKLFNNFRMPSTYYTKTQKWLGHVVAINEEGFSAVLKDLSGGGTDEYGEFSFKEITEDDLDLISLGAAFYMSLGFISDKGTRKKEEEIRFQRLADYNEDEIINNGLDMTSGFINYFK